MIRKLETISEYKINDENRNLTPKKVKTADNNF